MTNTLQENLIAEMYENKCLSCGHEPHCATACDYGEVPMEEFQQIVERSCDCIHCACDDCSGD